MKYTIYANYGVLAHEYEPVYRLHPLQEVSDAYDKLEIIIPEEIYGGINMADEPMINFKGSTFLLSEALKLVHKSTDKGLRVLCVVDRGKRATFTLPFAPKD